MAALRERGRKVEEFRRRLAAGGLGGTCEAAHAQLACRSIETVFLRRKLEREGVLKPLPEASQAAADKCYVDTANKLCEGLEAAVKGMENSKEEVRKQIWRAWEAGG